MTAPPLLSVGVPVYNGERYLAEALESALRQDYPNLEVVICDNGSTDSTPSICRRFEADPRVRCTRRADTIDAVANFGRVLAMARGKYFTWLAHDDVLTSTAYASTLVDALEASPDAVLCASALELFRDDDQQPSSVLAYANLTNGQPWPVARRALFRWPPGEWETLIYGIIRRDALQHHVSRNPSLRFVLQQLAFAGSFIVVPSALRGYRLHEESLGRQRVARSEFGLFVAGLALKGQLLRVAARSPAPLGARISLGLVALRNFFRDPVSWAHSVRRQIRTLEAELSVLAAAAEERRSLVPGASHARIEPARRRGRRSLHWFRRPDDEDMAYLKELTARVEDARRVCQELLAAMEHRGAENAHAAAR